MLDFWGNVRENLKIFFRKNSNCVYGYIELVLYGFIFWFLGDRRVGKEFLWLRCRVEDRVREL